jgi:hypothetical protein
MKTPFKVMLLSLVLLTFTVCLRAQEKYDYAIVKYMPPIMTAKPGLYISMSGKEFEKIEVKKDEVKDIGNDYSPLLNYVQKMTLSGWRVISTNNENALFSFTLEKKKN